MSRALRCLLLAAFLVAGCGATAQPTPMPSVTPTGPPPSAVSSGLSLPPAASAAGSPPGSVAPASAAPSGRGSAGPSAVASTLPSVAPSASAAPGLHAAPDLEALLPDSVAEVALSKESATGADVFMAEDPTSQAFIAFLQSYGKQPRDLVFAQAYDQSGTSDIFMAVFRADGIPTSALRDALMYGGTTPDPSVHSETVTMAGRQVTRVIYSESPVLSYLYEHGDVVFDVETSDPATAEAAFGLLP